MREIRQGACGAIRPINRAPTIGGVARPGAWRLTGPCGRPALPGEWGPTWFCGSQAPPGEWRPKASRRLLLMREIRQGACGAIRPINRAPTIAGVAPPGEWRLTGPCRRPALPGEWGPTWFCGSQAPPGEWRPKASRRLLLMREIRQGACGAIRPINRAPTIGGVARPGAWRLTGPCGRPALPGEWGPTWFCGSQAPPGEWGPTWSGGSQAPPGEWRPKASRRLLLMREIRQGACGAIRPINRAPTIGGVARPGAWRLTGPCGRPALPGEWGPTWFCGSQAPPGEWGPTWSGGSQAPPGEWRPKASRRLLLMREIRQGACGAIRPINRAPTIGGVARPGAWRLTGPCGRPALPGEWGPTWFCGSQAPPGEWRPKASRRLLLALAHAARSPSVSIRSGNPSSHREPFGLHSLGEPELPQGAFRSPFAGHSPAPTGWPQ